MASYYCVFCEIVAKREPATIEYEDERVVVFHNRLDWADVMLLAVPKQHIYQGELWTSVVMADVARAAVAAGERMCPKGFRLLSNFGAHAMQSQPHAHLHIIDGTYLRGYGQAPADVDYEDGEVVVFRNRINREPVTLLATPREPMTQRELWVSDLMPNVARAAAERGGLYCEGGFRLLSDIGIGSSSADENGHVHVIGGTYLGEYV